MKTILSISALVILSYSCNTSASKSDNTNQTDTNQSTPADTIIQAKDTIAQSVLPTPPPTVQQFVVPKIDPIIEDIDDVPPPINIEKYQTVDAGSNPYETGFGDDPDIGAESSICENPDVRPEFKPAAQLNTFIHDNLTYPEEALDMGITGIVNVTFIVERDGSISNIRIQKRSGHTQLDDEAKRVVRKMPRWSPGKLNGQAVRCLVTLPIHFEISD